MQTILYITLTIISLIVSLLTIYCTGRVLDKFGKEEGIDIKKDKDKTAIMVVILLCICMGTSFVAMDVEKSNKLLGYYILMTIVMNINLMLVFKIRHTNKTVSNLIPFVTVLILFYPVKELMNEIFIVWDSLLDMPFPYINFISWWWR
ncbi:hypothetical protein P9X10_02465 [Bacillus cereus]|nr:hypothetical protein [Bacillus cereus]